MKKPPLGLIYCAILVGGSLFGYWQMQQHAWHDTMAVEEAINQAGLGKIYYVSAAPGARYISREEGPRIDALSRSRTYCWYVPAGGVASLGLCFAIGMAIKLKRDSAIPSESSFNFVEVAR